MREEQLNPRHIEKRNRLRKVGKRLVTIGAILTAIGFGSFFLSFGSFGPPRFFWCAFLGLPMLFFGSSLLKFGYMGEIGRYVARESAPVAKDTFNYMADGTKDSVKTLAGAVGEGLGLKGETSEKPKSCHKCGAENDYDAKFCSQCGESQKENVCGNCGEGYDASARFCDECGKPV